MNKKEENIISIQRLTALWALTESGLGGVMHAFKSPFTGLFVGGIAMILITLIAHYADNPWQRITKSLVVVLIVKMLVSPHSMISAYFAVSFQAIIAAVIYSVVGVRLLPIILLTTLGYVESALQKIISLTVLYGKSIWEAIDALGNWISRKMGYLFPFQTSEALITVYVSCYFLTGILLGFFIFNLIKKINAEGSTANYTIEITKENIEPNQGRKKKKRLYRMIGVILGLGLLISLVLFFENEEGSSFVNASYVLLRTISILIIWYVLLAPILMRVVKRYLGSKKSELSEDIDQVFDIIPYLRKIVEQAWQESRGLSFFNRISFFVYRTLMYSLHFKVKEL